MTATVDCACDDAADDEADRVAAAELDWDCELALAIELPKAGNTTAVDCDCDDAVEDATALSKVAPALAAPGKASVGGVKLAV